ncbi:GDP-L-fucose synthase family protein [Paenibacillus xylanilyticus]|uniref:GDP-L-fucose synthase n=1 Tax=Paenibacillus xylanilyticus TaxID=248903 RepID=A0A7Y6BVE3_9BACL|nr:GDP-L-fucose synthase [Paenibacillus xylanilyticus]NUU75288.1 GDP-L-fucose synthase [Paenibacillus xylanilyticus]
MNLESKIYIAGHTGLVGSAIVRAIKAQGYRNLIFRSSQELDLRDKEQVVRFFHENNIDFVFLAAAKVGGIVANNDYPADFIRDNLQIQTNVIDTAYQYGVKKLLFLGSTCIYPKFAPQPLREDYLLTGELEETNEAYAIAKIAGIKMCQAYNRQYGTKYISVMPTNLYGPGDNFDLETSHVLPALLRKIHEAKQNHLDTVEIWGSGSPRREFLHSNDLADACLYLMNHYEGDDIVNIGTGEDISIYELANHLKSIIGFEGEFVFNTSRPDGTPRKWVDVSKLKAMGWASQISLVDGLKATYEWYTKQEKILSN